MSHDPAGIQQPGAQTSQLRASRPVFPFTALVGQERMKRALVLNAINPRIGGVLVRGEKGTAKSTAVRALANLLPEIDVVAGCHYQCEPGKPDDLCADCSARLGAGGSLPATTRRVPIVNLPVGATEDRVAGTIDIEEAITRGERRFEPGLLAAANRGILYVDEVNLLNDHLVDVLLDAAAMGMNYVEREGISLAHPAQFILIGTMNPEEGDLRPQLLDRFALAVEVQGLSEQASRAEVVRRRIAFERDPEAFGVAWTEAEAAERERITRARELLPRVVLDDRMLDLITHLCVDFGVDGLRADIVMYKTATTLAAYAERTRVDEGHVRDAAELALLHRRRRQPFEQPGLDPGDLDRAIQERLSDDDGHDGEAAPSEAEDENGSPEQGGSTVEERVFAAAAPYAVRTLAPPTEREERPKRAGRRSRARSRASSGHYVAASLPSDPIRDVALDATLRAAAPNQPARRAAQPDGPAVVIRRSDLREKVRETRAANLILFAVDASGSMAARQRMVAAKGAVVSLLMDAYQKRDRVGLIAFRGSEAELLLPPTMSVELAERRLQALPTGGRTPLARALQLGLSTFQRHRANHPDETPLLVLISDGRANVPLGGGDVARELGLLGADLRTRGVHAIVVDTESGPIRMGLGRELSTALGGRYLPIEDLRAGDLLGAVNRMVGRA
ncbi:MAG: putative cobaltochelatase [Chloroflexi bacterium]|nr:putative cobaltochelatase [Chloroflexota bacterium]